MRAGHQYRPSPVARLDGFVRGGTIRQGICLGDRTGQRPLVKGGVQPGDRLCALGDGQQIDQQNVDGHCLEQKRSECQFWHHVFGRAIGRNGAVGGDDFSVGGRVDAKFDFDDAINCFPAICSEDRSGQARVAIVDHCVCACIYCCCHAIAAGRGNHVRAAPFCKLNRQQTDCACPALDQHGLPCHITTPKHGVAGCQARNTQNGPCFQRDAIWQINGLLCG